MITLGIESSCDETSVAVLSGMRTVLSNVVNSQVELHGPFGGVVPEVASRRHVEVLPGVVREALRLAGVGWGDLDVVAATYGPGLASALLVGLAAAKGLALRLGKPLVPVNHLHGHLYSPFLTPGAPALEAVLPFLALVVSGGHTALVRVEGVGQHHLLGQTVDDAAGEAFDKGAKLLGLGYPGGSEIDRLSREVVATDWAGIAFPRTRVMSSRFGGGLDPELCFSFSGVKTALRYQLQALPAPPDPGLTARLAAAYQEAIVEALVARCDLALGTLGTLAVGGGVSLNRRLRERLVAWAEARGIRLLLTEPAYCSDNGAMIAAVAALRWQAGLEPRTGAIGMDITPSLGLSAF